MDDDDDTRACRKISQRNAIPATVNTVCLFESRAKLKQNCDPVTGALGPNPALSNPDNAHMPSASLHISHYMSHISRGEAGRVAVAHLLASPWTCTRCPTQSGTSQSCIAGLESGMVSASSSAFHWLWFLPTPCHLHRCCFPRIQMEAPCTRMEAHTSCCDLREHAVDGSIVIRWDWHFDPPFWFSLFDHRIHLGPPAHPILCHVRPICANTLCNGLLPSPHT